MAKWEPPLDLASSMPLDICCPMAGCWLVVQHYCRSLSLSLFLFSLPAREQRREDVRTRSIHDQRTKQDSMKGSKRNVIYGLICWLHQIWSSSQRGESCH